MSVTCESVLADKTLWLESFSIQRCFIIEYKGDALIAGINLQVIIFLVGADMEKFMANGHLDTLRGYNMHKLISIS